MLKLVMVGLILITVKVYSLAKLNELNESVIIYKHSIKKT